MIEYVVGSSDQRLMFVQEVVDHFATYRQLRFWQREAGGSLFARFADKLVTVERATGPRPTDQRTRWSYRPDRAAEQNEIDEFHRVGLHFIGTWHTHPERDPSPSGIDMQSIAEAVVRSRHALNGFVLVVVGQRHPMEELFVAACDAAAVYPLARSPVSSPASYQEERRSA